MNSLKNFSLSLLALLFAFTSFAQKKNLTLEQIAQNKFDNVESYIFGPSWKSPTQVIVAKMETTGKREINLYDLKTKKFEPYDPAKDKTENEGMMAGVDKEKKDRAAAFSATKVKTLQNVTYSPDKKKMAFTGEGNLYVYDPEARTSLKFFKEDGRFDVIATGSLLGVQGYGDEKKKKHRKLAGQKEPGINSVPVGSEEIVEMYPLDFEEFLWANGINTEVIEALLKFYHEETPVPAGIHVAMRRLLNLYVAVGGLPDAVNAFLETNNMNAVSKAYKSILKEYRDDMVKYAPDKDKPHIRECFNSIPKQLSKENKKFQYHMVKPGGRSETYLGSLQWLEDAGIACRCYNTNITGLPMEGNAKENVFKVYLADIGLLVEMLGAGTRADIIQGNLGGFKGAIFENLMADTLHKKEQSLYYFQKDSGLELDFLVRMEGECVPLEVKAKSAKAKSSKTVLAHPEKYNVKKIIKFGDYNVGRDGNLLTLPTYMQFLLDLEPEEVVLEPIDTFELTRLAKEVLANKNP